jgi:outer membrane protein
MNNTPTFLFLAFSPLILIAPSTLTGAEVSDLPVVVVANNEAVLGVDHRVTPQDLIARALKNNLGLEVSRLSAGIREDSVDGELGKFSPTLGVEVGMDRLYRQQNAAEFVNSGEGGQYDEEVGYARSTLGGRLPFGSTYELSSSSRRTRSTYTSRVTSKYDPEFGSNVKLTVTQPLLRNFGLKVGLAPLHIAKSDLDKARWETRSAIETVMARVLLACYETSFAIENVAVKQESIELAQALLEENKRRVELGRMSAINVTQAEARVAEARAELIEAESFYQRRQNQLQELSEGNYRLDAPDYQLSGVSESLPEVPARVESDALAQEMLAKNPDYKAAMQAVESEGIRVLYSKNQVYPEINLRMSIGTSGLEGDFGSSYSDFENREGTDWGVGLVFNMPLDNRTAKSRHRASLKRERQTLLEAKQTEVQLLGALDNAIYQLKAGIQRRVLIEDSVRLAREALVAEQRRLDKGVTTNYEVLNQQRELSFSQTEGLAAEVEVQKAWIQLLLLQGKLSEEMNFQVSFLGGTSI